MSNTNIVDIFGTEVVGCTSLWFFRFGESLTQYTPFGVLFMLFGGMWIIIGLMINGGQIMVECEVFSGESLEAKQDEFEQNIKPYIAAGVVNSIIVVVTFMIPLDLVVLTAPPYIILQLYVFLKYKSNINLKPIKQW